VVVDPPYRAEVDDLELLLGVMTLSGLKSQNSSPRSCR